MFQKFIQRLQTTEPTPFWSIGTALAFVAAFIVTTIAAQAFAATIIGGGLVNVAPAAPPLGIAIACLVNTIVIAQWVGRRAAGGPVKALRLFRTAALPLFVVILVGLAGAYAIDLFGVLSGLKGGQTVPTAFNILRDPNAAFFGWALAALVIIVIQPIGEEIVFRGLLYPALAGRFGNLAGIGLSALTFAIFSAILGNQGGAWYLFIQPLLMGLWVGMLRAYTQSTQMTIVARATFGLFFVLSALILK